MANAGGNWERGGDTRFVEYGNMPSRTRPQGICAKPFREPTPRAPLQGLHVRTAMPRGVVGVVSNNGPPGYALPRQRIVAVVGRAARASQVCWLPWEEAGRLHARSV